MSKRAGLFLFLISPVKWKLSFRCFFALTILFGCEHDLSTSRKEGFTELRDSGDFQTVYGTEHYDAGLAIIQMRDGGLLIAGSGNGTIAPADGTIEHPQLTKLNRQGKIEWTKIYFEYEYAYAVAALKTGNGDIITMINWFNQRSSIRLLKMNEFGNIIDPSFYERPESFTSRLADPAMSPTFDGGFVLTGSNERLAGSFATKIGGHGQVAWDREFDREVGFANSVIETSDREFMIVGVRATDTEGYDEQVMLLKINQQGNPLWTKTYGDGQRFERGHSVAETSDGGFIIAGGREAGANSDVFLLKVDANGVEQWSTSFGAGGYDSAYSILPVDNSGFVLAGRSTNHAGVWKIDAQGNLIWSGLFGFDSKIQEAVSIARLSDNKFAITGSTGPDEPSYGGSDFDVFLLVVD